MRIILYIGITENVSIPGWRIGPSWLSFVLQGPLQEECRYGYTVSNVVLAAFYLL